MRVNRRQNLDGGKWNASTKSQKTRRIIGFHFAFRKMCDDIVRYSRCVLFFSTDREIIKIFMSFNKVWDNFFKEGIFTSFIFLHIILKSRRLKCLNEAESSKCVIEYKSIIFDRLVGIQKHRTRAITPNSVAFSMLEWWLHARTHHLSHYNPIRSNETQSFHLILFAFWR